LTGLLLCSAAFSQNPNREQYTTFDSLFTIAYPASWIYEEKSTGGVVFPKQVVFTNPRIAAAKLTFDISTPEYLKNRGADRFWNTKFQKLNMQLWKPEWAECNGLKAIIYKKIEEKPEGRLTTRLWLVGNEQLYLRVSYVYSSFAESVVTEEIETINAMLDTLVILWQ